MKITAIETIPVSVLIEQSRAICGGRLQNQFYYWRLRRKRKDCARSDDPSTHQIYRPAVVLLR